MKEKAQALDESINEIHKEFKSVKRVFVKTFGFNRYWTEKDFRAFQVILARSSDENFKELTENVVVYNTPDRSNPDRARLTFRRDGCLESPFLNGFMSECDAAAKELWHILVGLSPRAK